MEGPCLWTEVVRTQPGPTSASTHPQWPLPWQPWGSYWIWATDGQHGCPGRELSVAQGPSTSGFMEPRPVCRGAQYGEGHGQGKGHRWTRVLLG